MNGIPGVASPQELLAALRSQQQALQAPQAPTVDIGGIQRDLLGANRQQQLAQTLLAQSQRDLPQSSGGINVLAALVQQFSGRRAGKQADERAADALARQQQAESQIQGFSRAQSEFDSKQKSIQERIDQLGLAQQAGIDPQRLAEFAVTGKLGAAQKEPDALRTLRALAEDPNLAAADQARRKASASSVTVNQGGTTAFDKELGKADAQSFVKLRDNAQSSANTLQRVGDVESILGSVQTGRVNEALARAGQIFGTDAAASFQSLKGAIQPLVLSEVRKLGSGNGITDADRKFIQAGMPGFGNDPRANATVIRIMRTGALVDQEVFKAAQEHLATEGSLRSFNPAAVISSVAPRIRAQLEREAGGTLASPKDAQSASTPGVIKGTGEFEGFSIEGN